MCAGADFTGTFRKCTFKSCTLSIVHGASATLSDCTWRDCCAAVIAHGPATTATLTTCNFSTCGFGVITEAGATVAMHSSTLHSPTAAAIVANDPGSHVTADGCEVHGVNEQGCGVHLGGGSARLRRCAMMNLATPVLALGRSSVLEIQGGYMTDSPLGICMHGHTWGTLRDAHIHGSTMPEDGVASVVNLDTRPGHPGEARLQMTRCDVVHPHSCALTVQHGSRAAASLCKLECTGSTILVMHEGAHVTAAHCQQVASYSVACCAQGHGASVRIQGGTVSAVAPACTAADGGALAIADAQLSGGRGIGAGELGRTRGVVSLARDATAALLRCTLRDGVFGLNVVEGSRVRAKEVRVIDMVAPPRPQAAGTSKRPSQSAAYACNGSQLDIEGGAVSNCLVGVDAAPSAGGAPSSVRVHGVKFTGYTRGMQVQKSEAEIADCEFLGSKGIDPLNYTRRGGSSATGVRGVVGLLLDHSQRASVRGCSFEGHDVHVRSEAPEGVHIEKCEFRNLADSAQICGVLVCARTVLEECSFVRMECAVSAQGGDADTVCEVRRCVFRDAMNQGVVATGRACVKVVGTEMHDVRSGTFALSGGTLALQDCEFHGCETPMGVGSGGGVLTAKRVTSRGGFSGVIGASQLSIHSGPKPGGAGKIDIKLESCDLKASRQTVFVRGENVSFSALKCELQSSNLGVIAESGATVRLKKSAVAASHCGVQVGEMTDDLEQPCEVCGLAGADAGSSAYSMLRLARLCPQLVPPSRAGESASRCPHQGARAVAVLRDVTVRGGDAGVQAMPHGRVDARAVHVTECETGFLLRSLELVEKSRFVGCTVTVPAGVTGAVAVNALDIKVGDRGGPNMGITHAAYEVEGVEAIKAAV